MLQYFSQIYLSVLTFVGYCCSLPALELVTKKHGFSRDKIPSDTLPFDTTPLVIGQLDYPMIAREQLDKWTGQYFNCKYLLVTLFK